jgi:hypothetical protein
MSVDGRSRWAAAKLSLPTPPFKVGQRAPPGLDLMVGLALGILDPAPAVALHGSAPVDLVADEAGLIVHVLHRRAKQLLEGLFVARGHGDAVADDDHVGSLERGPGA